MGKCFFNNKSVSELEKKGKSLEIVKKTNNVLLKELTRRALLEIFGSMSTLALVGSLNLSLSTPAEASVLNPMDVAKLINVSCVFCNLVGICIHNGIPAPKIHYRIPVGLSETGRAFQFGASAPVLGGLSSVVSSFVSDLFPFVPQGSMSIETGHGQTYMELYPHYYGFPPVIAQAIQILIQQANILNPICDACNILNEIINYIVPIGDIENAVSQELAPILSKISSITSKLSPSIGNKDKTQLSGFMKKLNKIFSDFQHIFKIIPIVPSELFFFIWNIEELSPDNYTIVPLLEAVMSTIPAIQLVCPAFEEYVLPHLPLPSLPLGFDPSFICVGYWGLGYPRIGIVRNDDPIEAGLLSIARWHNLMSRTIPLIQTPFDGNIFYQLYNPPIDHSCFRPGWFSSDITVNAINSISLSDFENLISNPQQAASSILSDLKNMAGREALELDPNYRNVGVVVWQEKTKCCW